MLNFCVLMFVPGHNIFANIIKKYIKRSFSFFFFFFFCNSLVFNMKSVLLDFFLNFYLFLLDSFFCF